MGTIGGAAVVKLLGKKCMFVLVLALCRDENIDAKNCTYDRSLIKVNL